MFSIYTNVNVMNGDEQVCSTSVGHNDDVVAIAREMLAYHPSSGATHIEIEMVLEKDGEIVYEGEALVSKTLRVPFNA